jgi:putative ABC transport system permease protein
MKLYTISKQSFKAIFANKGRSFLTILGIVIGIGSVIALMSLGNGVKSYISNQINALGSTTLRVSPNADFAQQGSSSNNASSSNSGGGIGGRGGGGGGLGGETSSLTVADYNSLLDTKKNPDLQSVIGTVGGSGIYGDQRFSVTGATVNLFSIGNQTINKGSLFTNQDVTQRNKVIVLGSDLSSNLFGSADPIGKTVTVSTDSYLVSGVLNQSKENSFNNPNLAAYVPYTAAMDSLGTQKFSGFTIRAIDQNSVDKAKTEIQNTLLANHGIKDLKLADFSVVTAQDLLSTIGSITTILTALLSGIAAISLLVGGIGIMNIMLVSVTERTREIGLRKAVGAKTSDILVQFLIEAIFLTLTGGVLGIGLGILMAKIAGHFVGFAPVTSTSAILLAVGISMAIGLIFGIYPAGRASRLNPIDALRYE